LSFNMKNAIPKLLRNELGSHVDIANAKSNASTHTNYLFQLFKERPSISRKCFRLLRGGGPTIIQARGSCWPAPRPVVVTYLEIHRGTPYPQRAGHYSGHWIGVNKKMTLLGIFSWPAAHTALPAQ